MVRFLSTQSGVVAMGLVPLLAWALYEAVQSEWYVFAACEVHTSQQVIT
jgi:hypothetical protein